MVRLHQSTPTTATLTVTFPHYDIFTGGAQNFTINVRKCCSIVHFDTLPNFLQVGAGIQYSNYLGYGDIPMATHTIILTQPGLISTKVPPDPIYYIPGRWISYRIQVHKMQLACHDSVVNSLFVLNAGTFCVGTYQCTEV